MSSCPSSIRFPARVKNATSMSLATLDELERAATLLEDLLPGANSENERKLCRKVIRSYRDAATRLLRRTWSGEDGQDIAEYAVMLAVILVIVVGTLRLIGSNANNAFSQAASAIQ